MTESSTKARLDFRSIRKYTNKAKGDNDYFVSVPTESQLLLINERDTLLAERDRLRELLRNILNSGVEFDDERIGYKVMQIDKRDLEDATTALKEGE